jgi:hypothetical protein
MVLAKETNTGFHLPLHHPSLDENLFAQVAQSTSPANELLFCTCMLPENC